MVYGKRKYKEIIKICHRGTEIRRKTIRRKCRNLRRGEGGKYFIFPFLHLSIFSLSP